MAAGIASSARAKDLRLERLHYLTLPVRDCAVARAFYCGVLGGGPVAAPQGSMVASTALWVKLGEAAPLLGLVEQQSGQTRPDDNHPHFAFEVPIPGEFDQFTRRLKRQGIPVLGPMTGTQIPAPPDGTPVHAQIYFNDPDGNHLELDCNVYPFAAEMYMKPFEGKPYDSWGLLYSWREWSDQYCFAGSAPVDAHEPTPVISALNHYTLPVRNHDRARIFYAEVLGGERIPTFSEMYRTEQSLPISRSSLSYLRLCAGFERLVLGEQPGGWPAPDSAHPLQAFAIPGYELSRWEEHLRSWGIPHHVTRMVAEPTASDTASCVAISFFDPDGNHLALVALGSIEPERMEARPSDPFALAYSPADWLARSGR